MSYRIVADEPIPFSTEFKNIFRIVRDDDVIMAETYSQDHAELMINALNAHSK